MINKFHSLREITFFSWGAVVAANRGGGGRQSWPQLIFGQGNLRKTLPLSSNKLPRQTTDSVEPARDMAAGQAPGEQPLTSWHESCRQDDTALPGRFLPPWG